MDVPDVFYDTELNPLITFSGIIYSALTTCAVALQKLFKSNIRKSVDLVSQKSSCSSLSRDNALIVDMRSLWSMRSRNEWKRLDKSDENPKIGRLQIEHV